MCSSGISIDVSGQQPPPLAPTLSHFQLMSAVLIVGGAGPQVGLLYQSTPAPGDCWRVTALRGRGQRGVPAAGIPGGGRRATLTAALRPLPPLLLLVEELPPPSPHSAAGMQVSARPLPAVPAGPSGCRDADIPDMTAEIRGAGFSTAS